MTITLEPPPDPGATSVLRAPSRDELPPAEEFPPLPQTAAQREVEDRILAAARTHLQSR